MLGKNCRLKKYQSLYTFFHLNRLVSCQSPSAYAFFSNQHFFLCRSALCVTWPEEGFCCFLKYPSVAFRWTSARNPAYDPPPLLPVWSFYFHFRQIFVCVELQLPVVVAVLHMTELSSPQCRLLACSSSWTGFFLRWCRCADTTSLDLLVRQGVSRIKLLITNEVLYLSLLHGGKQTALELLKICLFNMLVSWQF